MLEEIPEYGMDILRELINIGIGRTAGTLNELTRARIILEVPVVEVIRMKELGSHSASFDGALSSAVRINFDGFISGSTALIFDKAGAAALIYAITGEEYDKHDMDVMMEETLKEVGNICINDIMGSIGNILQERINYTPPRYEEGTVHSLFQRNAIDEQMLAVIVNTRFLVSEIQVNGYIMMVLEISSLEKILTRTIESGG